LLTVVQGVADHSGSVVQRDLLLGTAAARLRGWVLLDHVDISGEKDDPSARLSGA
jgi:hypothetical protein